MVQESSLLSVLWATDGSEEASSAMPMLRSIVLPAVKRLVVLSVAPRSFLSGARPDPAFLTRITPAARRKALLESEEEAQEAATQLDPPEMEVEAISRWGNPIEEILKASRSRNADLIVLGAKGHSNLGLIFVGSVSQGVVQHATKPVLVARPGSGQVRRVLIGYHGSPSAKRAVQFLDRLALPHDAVIHLADVVEPFSVPRGMPSSYRKPSAVEIKRINEHRVAESEAELQALAEQMRAEGRPVHVQVFMGEPGPELDSAARRYEADLIVVGSRRPAPAKHQLVGSTAEKLVRHSHTSVLVVR